MTKLSSIFEVGISYWFSYYNKKNPDLPSPGGRGSTSTRQPLSKVELLRCQKANIDATWAQLWAKWHMDWESDFTHVWMICSFAYEFIHELVYWKLVSLLLWLWTSGKVCRGLWHMWSQSATITDPMSGYEQFVHLYHSI